MCFFLVLSGSKTCCRTNFYSNHSKTRLEQFAKRNFVQFEGLILYVQPPK